MPALATTLALAALVAAPAQATGPRRFEVYASPQQRVVLADGRRMNLFCSGAGSPTVLLEGGWSDSNVVWRLVQPLVARRTRVCSYDRAGLGFSDPAPGPRDTLHIVEDLERLIAAARLKGPYVLVGFSMGSLSMRLFADRHLADIAGMVLVEPSSEGQTERFTAALPGRRGRIRPMTDLEPCPAGQAGCGPADASTLPQTVVEARARQAAAPAYQQAILAELLGMTGDGSAQVASARRSYGALPLIVLTGAANVGDPGYGATEVATFQRVWREMHDELAGLSSRGERRSVSGATHMMALEQPEIVARAIVEVMGTAQHPSR